MMTMTARSLFGNRGDGFRSWYSRFKRSPRRFTEDALPVLRKTWDSGDESLCDAVLSFIAASRSLNSAEAMAILWEGLDCQWEHLRGVAVIALMDRIRHGLRPSRYQVTRLVRATRSENSASTKSLLLFALQDLGCRRLGPLLVELAADESPEVRFDANIRLLRRGKDTKAALFNDLPSLGWNYHFGVERLWWERERLYLTASEEELLRDDILKEMARRRRVCREEKNPENTALFIFSWIKKGFPSEPEDIDFLAHAAQRIHFNREQLDAVRAVAWFKNERAIDWLRRMTLEPYRPSVRREARRQLRLLERV